MKKPIKKVSKPNKKLKAYIIDLPELLVANEDQATYHTVLQDKHWVVSAVRYGVTNPLFEEIRSNSPFNDMQWCNFLDINIRTLQRYKIAKDHVYRSLQSEKIFELAEVVSLGNEVFDTPEHFGLWLNLPSVALGGEAPIDLLDNSYGKDIVLAELNRIEHGIFV